MQLVKKSDSTLMAVLGFVLRLLGNDKFNSYFWTTLNDKIYVPTYLDGASDWGTEAWRHRHRYVIAHEMVHVQQFKKWGFILMALGYIGPAPFLLPLLFLDWRFVFLILLLAPLTVGLAYFRWRIERRAYLIQYMHQGLSADWIARTLWRHYLFTWPQPWARRWFRSVG